MATLEKLFGSYWTIQKRKLEMINKPRKIPTAR
jgi:hypothetical protein